MSRTDKDRPYKFRSDARGYGYRAFWPYYCPVPKWFIDCVWNNPQRVHERDTLRKAVQDYNANGDTDIETINVQSRGCAQWYYW